MSEKFEYTAENKKEFEDILRRYPVKRAALLPALHLAQQQHGYIPPEAEEYVAGLLEVPLVDVREVLTFYSLFNRRPMGRSHIRVCMSLSCWLRGATNIKAHLRKKLNVDSGSATDDGRFSWEAVADCMGDCEHAPMIQLDKDYYGPLTPEKVDQVLADAVQRGADQ